MREFLSLIIMPLPVLYLILVIAIILFISGHKRTGKILFIIAGIWFFIITTPMIPRTLVKSLENKYPQLTEESIKNFPDSCDIIILGGGHSDDKELSPNNQLSNVALGRIVEGIRIQKMIPGSRLILSGYRGRSEISQASILYRTALILGVDSASMVMQILPANTRMEAAEYIRNFGSEKKLIVVTSDIHMPRAMLLFKKAGLSPVAAPTNQLIKYGSVKYRWRWIPSSVYIMMMEVVIHEYTGILWAFIGGK